jgi:ribosomal protein S18 acetylase RimI-like enzyme
MIRPMTLSDAGWAAAQHAALMKNSAFARLGTSFLECFYRCFATSPTAVAYVHEEDGVARAIIAATSDRPAFLRQLLRQSWFRLVIGALRGLIRNPRLLFSIRPLRYLREIPDDSTKAEMVFITVAPEARERGIARRLIETTLSEYVRRGVRKVKVTIEDENLTVKRVLQGLGFEVKKTFMFAGKKNNLLERTLPGGEQGGQREKASTT